MSLKAKILEIISPSAYMKLLTSAKEECRVIPVDATWYLPNLPYNGKDQYLNEKRLPAAAYFDLDTIAQTTSPYPHMFPTYSVLLKAFNDLGFRKSDTLVFYDKSGVFSGPRAAWTASLFGHPKIYFMDNYQEYEAQGYPISTNKVTSTDVKTGDRALAYEQPNEDLFNEAYRDQIIEFEDLLNLVQKDKMKDNYITFDARSYDRFTGRAPEPRPGLPSGSIPHANSLPFGDVLTPSKSFKSRDELLNLFKEKFGIDFTKENPTDGKGIIVMCGSGTTAVILLFALKVVIQTEVPVRVYDGSWSEWAARAPSDCISKTV